MPSPAQNLHILHQTALAYLVITPASAVTGLLITVVPLAQPSSLLTNRVDVLCALHALLDNITMGGPWDVVTATNPVRSAAVGRATSVLPAMLGMHSLVTASVS